MGSPRGIVIALALGAGCPALTEAQLDARMDADGDGHRDVAFGGDDCDDGSPGVSPDGVEACNGEDDDCNSTVDDAVAEYDGPVASHAWTSDRLVLTVDAARTGPACGPPTAELLLGLAEETTRAWEGEDCLHTDEDAICHTITPPETNVAFAATVSEVADGATLFRPDYDDRMTFLLTLRDRSRCGEPTPRTMRSSAATSTSSGRSRHAEATSGHALREPCERIVNVQ